jgi:hypothetical protein
MLHRLRLALQDRSTRKLGGHVELDETYIGGKPRNMHYAKRKRMGLDQRSSRWRARLLSWASGSVTVRQVHTNGCEHFWSLLKRSIKGTYVSVEPFHLFRYLDEQAFRLTSVRLMTRRVFSSDSLAS